MTFRARVIAERDFLVAFGKKLNRELGEDLAHDCIERALRYEPFYTEQSQLRPWLARILRNNFTNVYWKQKGAAENTFHVPGAHAAQNTAPAPEPELSGEIAVALAELSPRMREVLTLADLREFSYREIAEELQIPLGTVMSRLYRARRAFAAALAQFERQEAERVA